MSLLKVYLHGQEIGSLDMINGQSYVIGRGSDCSIQLPPEKGISRQHIRLTANGAAWIVERLSKTGTLLLDGQQVTQIPLDQSCHFNVPPFEFEFRIGNGISKPQDDVAPAEPMTNTGSSLPKADPQQQYNDEDYRPLAIVATDNQPNFDTTQPGFVALVPYLTLVNRNTGDELVYKLEGHVWAGGRHPSAEIFIDDAAISRKHFEISQSESGYFIRELGSANGVILNGQTIEANRDYPLSSGDKFSIRHIELTFEIHDERYAEKIQAIKALPAVADQSAIDPNAQPISDQDPINASQLEPAAPAVMRMDPSIYNEPKKSKAPRVLILGAVAVLLVLGVIFSKDDKQDLPSKTPSGASGGVNTPSAEQLSEAKHLFDLAKNYYRTRNYEFCLNQIEKLHTLVPSFENSKELETYCTQAIDLERINEDRERKERERDEVGRRIRDGVEKCRSLRNASSERMRDCLSPVLELSPDNQDAMAMITALANQEEVERINAQNAASHEARRNRARNAFEKAKSADTIAAYKEFLNGGWNMAQQEGEARDAIKRIEGQMESKANEFAKQCSTLVEASQFRDAIKECKKALDIQPGNAQAKSLMDQAKQKQSVELKKLYEQAILEEGFGNVDAAKVKWKEIIQASGRGEKYYDKAASKLKKYGGLD